jgi:hypothetical protein
MAFISTLTVNQVCFDTHRFLAADQSLRNRVLALRAK